MKHDAPPITRPKVSVVVPNYNHGRFLEQRFASIFNQTFQDFEVIFLDDASRDDSLRVFERFAAHPKITKRIINEQNTGSPYLQWNRGAREAGGTYLWIAESDDYADPQFLERLVAMLDANPNVGVAFCKSMKVDENGRAIGTTDDWTGELGARWSADFTASGLEECGADLMRKCFIPNVSSALIRLDRMAEVGYAHASMRYCGDYLTYAKLFAISDLAYVSTPLNYFRFSSQTMRTKMGRSWLHELERTQTMAYVFRHYPISNEALARAKQLYIENLIRLSADDWRFARAWLSRIKIFTQAANSFCPHFVGSFFWVGSRMVRRAVGARLRKISQ